MSFWKTSTTEIRPIRTRPPTIFHRPCWRGYYYFRANDGESGAELWRTNGPGNVVPVGDAPDAEPGSVVSSRGLIMTAPRPNPSDHATAFTLQASMGGPVTVRAFDASGRTLGVLFSGELDAGVALDVSWDLRDVAPGAYFIAVDTRAGRTARRVVRMP